MSIVDLLPAALAAWKPRRAAPPPDVQLSHPIAVPRPPVTRSAVALPRNTASVARETQTVLTGVSGHARSRFVELQVAVEPGLVVQADPADYRMCLRDLLLAAIGRASGGVLVTAMRQPGGVEITVLDDGIAVSDAQPDGPASGADDMFVPAGGTLCAGYRPQCGTTVRLHLPQPDGLALPSDADADGEVPIYAGR